MSAAARLLAFGLGLAALFAAAAAVGAAVGPLERGGEDGMAAHAEEQPSAAPPGLALAQDGLRLEAAETTLAPGRAQRLSFRIVADASGDALSDYEVTHERRMHLIVVRRDLTGFQHLHPELGSDGTWTATVAALQPGAYRAFADFSTGGEKRTLGVDLLVPGAFEPQEPADDPQGAELLGREHSAGEETRLEFAVPGETLEEYLGARGHLVLLREGDLAYLHTHAEENELAFETTFPSAGRYRAFLQFQVAGRVRTAAFTLEVGP